MASIPWTLSPDRCFDSDPTRRTVARELYAAVKDLPLVSPHGHVLPALLADPAARFGSLADLFIIPDHYVVRMLYSQGVALEDLGVPTRDGSPVETDHRRIWQRFAEHFYLFRGSPSGLWLSTELVELFSVDERLNGDSAQRIYDHLEAQLARPEFARMSAEDKLVMQLHVGSLRNHNAPLFERFGPDMGADIPIQTEWTRNLQPLLNAYGADPRFQLILFTLDESTYSRELAPLAGHYPAVLLGPPWWFYDSINGMRRYFDHVIETAGLYNTAGFNDDTRAFASIPARHDVWRRVSCDWQAGLVVQGLLDEAEAAEMAYDCAYGQANRAYKLDKVTG